MVHAVVCSLQKDMIRWSNAAVLFAASEARTDGPYSRNGFHNCLLLKDTARSGSTGLAVLMPVLRDSLGFTLASVSGSV